MRRILIIPALLLSLLVAGCGGSSTKTTTGAGAGSTSSAAVAGASSPDATGSTGLAAASADCPTSNTKSFAKTRFVADVGGALFLMNRYVLKPYRAGSFTKGAHGRTVALIKAGTAVAGTAKLVKNAQANAKANPTLCKSVSGPLSKLSSGLTGVVSGLKSGSLSGAGISGLGGLLGSVTSGAAKAGIPVKEQPVSLR